jgi:hypothetical protein
VDFGSNISSWETYLTAAAAAAISDICVDFCCQMYDEIDWQML